MIKLTEKSARIILMIAGCPKCDQKLTKCAECLDLRIKELSKSKYITIELMDTAKDYQKNLREIQDIIWKNYENSVDFQNFCNIFTK